MNELTIGDKVYISSKRAAEITGYAKDYVGQLCREGHVEAKMVGRSWYVLETSIKAHRFGADLENKVPEAILEPESVVEDALLNVTPEQTTWKAATYVAEAPEKLPELIPSATVEAEETVPASETLSDMQSAWQEWFSKKQELRLETPEVIDAREEAEGALPQQEVKSGSFEEHVSAHEENVPEVDEPVQEVIVHRIQSTPEAEQMSEEEIPVSIHKVASSVAKPLYESKNAAVRREPREVSQVSGSKSGSLIRVFLWVLIVITIGITLLSTGMLDNYLLSSSDNTVVKYLTGTK